MNIEEYEKYKRKEKLIEMLGQLVGIIIVIALFYFYHEEIFVFIIKTYIWIIEEVFQATLKVLKEILL